MRANEIELKTLNELFYIDSDFNLRWKVKRNGTKGIDSIVGYVSKFGYLLTQIQGRQYTIHRIIYQIANQVELQSNIEIDHIDCNKLNNNPLNLRLATASQNSKNRKIRYDNKSGYKGVTYCNVKCKWRISFRIC